MWARRENWFDDRSTRLRRSAKMAAFSAHALMFAMGRMRPFDAGIVNVCFRSGEAESRPSALGHVRTRGIDRQMSEVGGNRSFDFLLRND
jgi:hypothetical protein